MDENDKRRTRYHSVVDAYLVMSLVNWELDPRHWSYEWWRVLLALLLIADWKYVVENGRKR